MLKELDWKDERGLKKGGSGIMVFRPIPMGIRESHYESRETRERAGIQSAPTWSGASGEGMRKRIVIDMDETIADTLSRHIQWYNRDFAANLDRRDLEGKEIHQAVPPQRRRAVQDYPRHPDFFRDLTVMEGAREVVGRLNGRFEVFIASSAMEYPASFEAKYSWLRRHFPFVPRLNYVFCGDKSILSADYMIDDSPRHFERFAGGKILFSAPHNLTETRFDRVGSWFEVEGLLASGLSG